MGRWWANGRGGTVWGRYGTAERRTGSRRTGGVCRGVRAIRASESWVTMRRHNGSGGVGPVRRRGLLTGRVARALRPPEWSDLTNPSSPRCARADQIPAGRQMGARIGRWELGADLLVRARGLPQSATAVSRVGVPSELRGQLICGWVSRCDRAAPASDGGAPDRKCHPAPHSPRDPKPMACAGRVRAGATAG